MENGPLEYKICVLHKCDNPICVRLDHLFTGTVLDNNQDKSHKGRAYFGVQKSENQPTAKLTQELVAEIRARFAAGESQRRLALDYSVGFRTIHKVVRYKSWK